MREIKPNEIIINSQGETHQVYPSRIEKTTPKENIIAFPDKKEIDVDWRRNFNKLSEISKLVEANEIVQNEGKYNVPLDHPEIPFAVGFVFSDAHIGSYSTDHDLIRDFLETVIATPNSFLVDVGDTFDNGAWGSLANENILPPYMQAFTVEDIIRELGDKYAACVVGNHPEWMFSQAGIKPETTFAKLMKGPVFPGMGLLHLTAGKQSYDWALAHTYWGRSKKNIFNVCVNLRQNEYPNADVFTVGHEHIWGYGEEMVDRKKKLYIRPGTAKINDRYARMHGIARRGQEMGIAVIFGTETRSFDAYDIDTAVKLQFVREEIANLSK